MNYILLGALRGAWCAALVIGAAAAFFFLLAALAWFLGPVGAVIGAALILGAVCGAIGAAERGQ